MSADDFVAYFAVYRSRTTSDPEDGYDSVCIGLFDDANVALDEARRLLADGYHIMIDRGRMTLAEWDALEEVPDDFVAQLPDPTVQP